MRAGFGRFWTHPRLGYDLRLPPGGLGHYTETDYVHWFES